MRIEFWEEEVVEWGIWVVEAEEAEEGWKVADVDDGIRPKKRKMIHPRNRRVR